MKDIKEPKKDTDKEQNEVVENTLKSCFVIMPISDGQGYEAGHFKRVYEYIIKPACLKAGFDPIRADDVKATNIIVIDIIKKIINSDMAVCDLSSRNPNVFYELGIRQSFDLPVTLLKDDLTDRIFDTQGFRDVVYSNTLRIDEVKLAVEALADSIKETYEHRGKDINSIVQMLGITKASLKEPVSISSDTNIILNSINNLGRRVLEIEESVRTVRINQTNVPNFFQNANGHTFIIGDTVIHPRHGTGVLIDVILNEDGALATKVRFNSGTYLLNQRDYKLLESDLPF